MAISYSEVPGNARVPWVYVEFDASRAQQGLGARNWRALLVGQKLDAGTAATGEPVPVATVEQAREAFGEGSMLALMAASYRRQDPSGELWAVALADGTAAKAAVRTLTVGGEATKSGVIALYVAGRRFEVPVAVGDDQDAVAARINTVLGAGAALPVTASVSDEVVTLTARHAGEAAADVDVSHSLAPGEALPAGVTLAVATTTAGAVDPDVGALGAAIGDEEFEVIATAYTGVSQMTALETELDSRWDAMRQLDGMAFAAYKGTDGTAAQATTYGNARNNPRVSVMDAGKSPTPAYEWAAAVAGVVARHGALDPARPMQTLPLVGIVPPPVKSRREWVERNTLLWDGISTYKVGRDSTVRVERLITCYQRNAAGATDTAWLDVNSPLTLSYLRRTFREMMLRKYPRHKLADDGTRFGAGQAVITPKIAKAEVVALFRRWEERGLVEGGEQFKADLIVERNADDVNRLDFLMSPNLMNQLRVAGAQIQFLL